ncbi:MAG: aminoglycoside N(3)-acetyltransferase [Trebonia sp.]
MSALAVRGDVRRTAMTRERLAADLRALGVRPGQTILVHASLRQIGWVDGGAPTVVTALRETLGPRGTLVAGTGTPGNSLTSRAHHAVTDGLSPAQAVGFRGRMPPFDPERTPTSSGAVAEALRTTPGAARSDHPQSSFAAVGYRARQLMSGHRLTCHYGADSPLAKLYRQGASVLLLGVGFGVCTAFHLAEYRYTEHPPRQTFSCVVRARGKRHWLTYQDVVLDDSEFEIIGKYFEEHARLPVGNVGDAPARLICLRQAVDFATQWMADHRISPGRPGTRDLSNGGGLA